jgi:hypothetical protein
MSTPSWREIPVPTKAKLQRWADLESATDSKVTELAKEPPWGADLPENALAVAFGSGIIPKLMSTPPGSSVVVFHNGTVAVCTGVSASFDGFVTDSAAGYAIPSAGVSADECRKILLGNQAAYDKYIADNPKSVQGLDGALNLIASAEPCTPRVIRLWEFANPEGPRRWAVLVKCAESVTGQVFNIIGGSSPKTEISPNDIKSLTDAARQCYHIDQLYPRPTLVHTA